MIRDSSGSGLRAKIPLDFALCLCYYEEVSKEDNIAEWSSLVARRAHNPKVVGSNPASATTKTPVTARLRAFYIYAPT